MLMQSQQKKIPHNFFHFLSLNWKERKNKKVTYFWAFFNIQKFIFYKEILDKIDLFYNMCANSIIIYKV